MSRRGGTGVLGATSEHGDESLRANDSRMVAVQSGGPRPLVPPLDLIAADAPPASFHALRTLKWIDFELLFIVGSLMSHVPPWSLRSPYAAGLPTAHGACTNVAVVDARRRGSAVFMRKGLEVRNGQSSVACRRAGAPRHGRTPRVDGI